MWAPAASTVTQPRSSAAKAARVRALTSLRHRPASSSSSPRSTTSWAPCRAATTARARTVARPQLRVSSQRKSQTNIPARTTHQCVPLDCFLFIAHRSTTVYSVLAVELPQSITSYSVVSDGHAHKVPASSVARRARCRWWRRRLSGHFRWDRCARPLAVRVTAGSRSFSVHRFITFFGSCTYLKWK